MIPPMTIPVTAPASAVTSQLTIPPKLPTAVARPVRGLVDDVRNRAPEVKLLDAVEEDSAADPQHRRGADRRQAAQQFGNDTDQRIADCARAARAPLRHVKADVVELHDERDDAIDAGRDRQRDRRSARGPW